MFHGYGAPDVFIRYLSICANRRPFNPDIRGPVPQWHGLTIHILFDFVSPDGFLSASFPHALFLTDSFLPDRLFSLRLFSVHYPHAPHLPAKNSGGTEDIDVYKRQVHYRPLIFCTQHNTFQQVTKKTIHKKPVDEIINIHGIFCPSCLT